MVVRTVPGTPGSGRRQGRRAWHPPAAAGNSAPGSRPGPALIKYKVIAVRDEKKLL